MTVPREFVPERHQPTVEPKTVLPEPKVPKIKPEPEALKVEPAKKTAEAPKTRGKVVISGLSNWKDVVYLSCCVSWCCDLHVHFHHVCVSLNVLRCSSLQTS